MAKEIVIGIILGFFATLFLIGVAKMLIDLGSMKKKKKGGEENG